MLKLSHMAAGWFPSATGVPCIGISAMPPMMPVNMPPAHSDVEAGAKQLVPGGLLAGSARDEEQLISQ